MIDGDTLTISGESVGLHGIDAPASARTCDRNSVTWPCGAEASKVLRELVKGQRMFRNEAEARAAGWRRSRQ